MEVLNDLCLYNILCLSIPVKCTDKVLLLLYILLSLNIEEYIYIYIS